MLKVENTVASVEGAAKLLVEMASASEDAYTVEDLQYLVEEQIDSLSEAGGLISWLKRAYTGMDDTQVGEMEAALDKIKTPEEKVQALAHIDKLLKEAKGITSGQALYHLLVNGPYGLGVVATILFRSTNKDKRAAYMSALRRVRSQIAALKVKGE